MKLSTMTNLYYTNSPDKKGFINSIKKLNEVGFKTLDFCMCPMQRGETELNGDDWESIVYDIANESAKLGVEFAQSHIPYPKPNFKRKTPFDEGCEQNEYFVAMTERAVRISAMLGVKWTVAHPVQNTETDEFCSDADIAYNHFIYDRHVEYATKHGVGVAFENMVDKEGHRRFGVTAEELKALVDSYAGAKVGVCWDFGHGNRSSNNQHFQIAKLQGYLKATHVDDNVGTDDLHTMPFLGNVKWNKIMPLLKEIKYDGAFNYEVAVMKRLPDELKDYMAKLLLETGNYLISLAQ